MSEWSKIFGIGYDTLYSRYKKKPNDLDYLFSDKRNQKQTLYTFICKECGKEFKNPNKNKVFCSDNCRKIALKRNLSNKRKDLTNERFGKLVALYSRNVNKRYEWLCKCDCDNEIWVKTANLINGHTQSCGCINKARENFNKNLEKYRKKNYVENTNISMLKSTCLSKNNSSGVKGVYWSSSGKCWVAKLICQGTTHRKYFAIKEDAIKCRNEWEEEYIKPLLDKYNKKLDI